jgi:copper transport protein
VLVTMATMVVGAGPASAHVELVGSEPAAGATVTGPIDHVTLTFVNPVTPVADQFALLDADGNPLEIASVTADAAGTTIDVVPAEPLQEGPVGLRWAARAGDAHPLVDTITFSVAASTPAEAPTGVTPTESEATDGGAEAPSALTAALEPNDTTTAERLAALSRFVTYIGLLLAVGGIIYLALVHRGTRDEGRRLTYLVRRAALLVIAGTLLEIPFQAAILAGSASWATTDLRTYGDVLHGDFAIGVLLRLAGAVLVLLGMRMTLDTAALPASATHFDDDPAEAARAGVHGAVATRTRPRWSTAAHRVRVEASPLAIAGAIALVASASFIGHTASTDPQWLVVTSAAVHLGAGGLWFAGVTMLAATLWRRRRRGTELDAALLVNRFSTAAVGAVAAVSITGIALALAILGNVGNLFSTDFGQLLLVKIALVGVLVLLGAYNHLVLGPALERPRTARTATHRLRTIATAEVALLLAVITLTAFLVGADST